MLAGKIRKNDVLKITAEPGRDGLIFESVRKVGVAGTE
jgi:hypothetical protein